MLRIKQSSELKMALPIVDDFVVMVRRLGPTQQRDLSQKASKPQTNRITGLIEQIVDDELWVKLAPNAYIVAEECKGLTASAIRKLGIELEEEPATNGDGYIPVTPEILVDLWKHAQAAKFAVPVINFSREMLTITEIEKKSASGD